MVDMYGSNLDFESFSRLLSKDDLEEEPIPLERFVTDRKYLGLPPLSPIQLEIAKHMTQIFKKPTLIQLHGEDDGIEIYDKYTVNEVIALCGKGAGKDHVSRVCFSYIAYLLHCLRDPLSYYGKAHSVSIDLLNLAVNSQQAQRVFFEPFKNLLLQSPYFNDVGFEPRVGEVKFFSRPIRCFSGHSEAEGWEGYELHTVVLDEIAAFKTDVELKGEARAKGSASQIYNMAKLSVMSRFPEVGKVVLLSFPRYSTDFIMTRYKEFEKNDEPKTWGIKAATFDMNPTITREALESEYIRNPVQAKARFECEPPEMEDAFFREPRVVRAAFNYDESPIGDDGTWEPWFNGTDGYQRYIHCDLGQKRDKAAICMVHTSGLKEVETLAGIETLPIINMDLIYYWRAAPNEEIPFSAVRKMIVDLSRKFDVAMVSFDYWQSIDMIQSLRGAGIRSEAFTVKKAAYDTLSTAIYDGRLRGYWDEQLVENELLKLRLINNNKIDHPAKGEKDAADALAGSVWACLQNIGSAQELEIEIWGDAEMMNSDLVIDKIAQRPEFKEDDKEMPDDLKDWLFEVI